MFRVLINNLLYVPSKCFSNCLDMVHVSEPYRSMLSTQVLNKFIFVLVCQKSIWCEACYKVPQAYAFLISKSILLDDIYDPRYLKSSTCFNIFPFKDLTSSCSQSFTKMYSVLLQFMRKPTLLAARSCECKRDRAFSKLSDVRTISSA